MTFYKFQLQGKVIYEGWKLALRAWKVDHDSYCVENYLSDFKICDLTRKQFLFYLNRLKVPNEYIEFSFGNIIELEDYNEERN